MEFYIYNADLYCDACGRDIRKRIKASGRAPRNERDFTSYSSDEYPVLCWDGCPSDGPQHCGSGSDCLQAEVLPSGQRVGAIIDADLTREGVEFVNEMIKTRPHSEVVRLWVDHYSRKHEDILTHPDDLDEPYFDRFDIVEAYAVLEHDWNTGGILWERPTNRRRSRSTRCQIERMGQSHGAGWVQLKPNLSYEALSDNGKSIYWRAAFRMGLIPAKS